MSGTAFRIDPATTNRSPIEADCARLARSAERWGAGGQASTLAHIAQLMAAGDIVGAAKLRDELLNARNSARRDTIQRVIELTVSIIFEPILAVFGMISRNARPIRYWLAEVFPEVAFWTLLIAAPFISKFFPQIIDTARQALGLAH
jgi:hypothetical protein